MGSRTAGAAIVGWLMLSQACMAQLVNENLLTNFPDGYKIGYQNRNDKELISEMVPQNEAVENWTEMVTVQIFFGQKIGARSIQGAYREALGGRLSGRRAKVCERRLGARLCDGDLGACVPPKSGDQKARDNVVQGDPGQ